MNLVKIDSVEKTIQEGRGVLFGASNEKPQPGKTATFFDGNTVLCKLELVLPFAGPSINDPEILLNVVFVNNLRVVTDGEVIAHWY